jgi:hypothetical protein
MWMSYAGSSHTQLRAKRRHGTFFLSQASIIGWNASETALIEKFGEDKIPTT